MQLDAVTLRRLWPHAPQQHIDASATRSAAVFAKYGLTTSLRVVHFMAQISHECGGGTITRESLNYSSAARIAAVWPRRFTEATAAPYVHNERGLADVVYNGRMGNAPGSDDGYNFRGCGYLQLTGRQSFHDIGAAVGLPLEQRPELASSPMYALEVAAAEFKALGCLPYCDADNVEAVTRRVNGGYTGLASRKAWLARWKHALLDEVPDGDPAIAEAAPAAVQIPRGSDEVLPAAVDNPGKTVLGDRGAWATVLGVATAIGSQIGQAVDALKPLVSDPRTIGTVIAVVAVCGLVLLWEKRASLRNEHV